MPDPAPPPTLDQAVATGQKAFNDLCTLQAAAIGKGDVVTMKALGDDIQTLGTQLSQLYGQQIDGNADKIAALNTQLGAVTTAAQGAESDLASLTNVINNVVAASKLLDGILSLIKMIP